LLLIFIFTPDALEYCAFYSCAFLLLPWKIALNLKISHVTRRESISASGFSFALCSCHMCNDTPCEFSPPYPLSSFPTSTKSQLHFACHSANGVVFSPLFLLLFLGLKAFSQSVLWQVSIEFNWIVFSCIPYLSRG